MPGEKNAGTAAPGTAADREDAPECRGTGRTAQDQKKHRGTGGLRAVKE